MDAESHDGVVSFERHPSGRQTVKLGRLPIGEIGPVHDPRSLYPAYWRLDLPCFGSRAWEPANSAADARRQVLARINDWLNAANLRPN